MLVADFLTNLKVRARIQANQTVLSDADLIRFANDELRMVICPKILSVREDYFVGIKDYALTSSRRYRLPSRVLGGRLIDVKVISNGEEYSLPQRHPQDNKKWDIGFYVSEGEVFITGDQVPTGTLRLYYPIRPPKMDSSVTTFLREVDSVSSSNVVVDGAALGPGTFEIIRVGSPYRTISPNMVFSASTTGTDFDCSTEYERFAAGDYVINQDATFLVPLEDELCDWLLQRTAMRVYEALGHENEMSLAGAKLADIERDCLALISPRVSNEEKTVTGMESAGWRNW